MDILGCLRASLCKKIIVNCLIFGTLLLPISMGTSALIQFGHLPATWMTTSNSILVTSGTLLLILLLVGYIKRRNQMRELEERGVDAIQLEGGQPGNPMLQRIDSAESTASSCLGIERFRNADEESVSEISVRSLSDIPDSSAHELLLSVENPPLTSRLEGLRERRQNSSGEEDGAQLVEEQQILPGQTGLD